MNLIISFLTAFVFIYIIVCAFKYTFDLILKTAIVITGSTLVYQHAGQTGLLTILVISPVLYIALSDFIESFRSVKSFRFVETQTVEQCAATDLVETAPLTGEWISGKTPRIAYQQILIGDVKALPKPWL